MNKFVNLLTVGVLALIAVLGITSGTRADAAGEVPNDIPATAAVIDGQPLQINGDSSLWFKFQYGLDHSEGKTQGEPVTVTLAQGTQAGLDFEVYTPDAILNWWENEPVGRGTPQLLSEDNVPVLANADHFADDLTWVGRFAADGTYFVRVINHNPFAVTFSLFMQDSAVQ